METKKPKFEEGKEYLVRRCDGVYKIKILNVTKTCYFIDWGSYKEWKTTDYLDGWYDILEELPCQICNIKEF